MHEQLIARVAWAVGLVGFSPNHFNHNNLYISLYSIPIYYPQRMILNRAIRNHFMLVDLFRPGILLAEFYPVWQASPPNTDSLPPPGITVKNLRSALTNLNRRDGNKITEELKGITDIDDAFMVFGKFWYQSFSRLVVRLSKPIKYIFPPTNFYVATELDLQCLICTRIPQHFLF